MEAYRVGVALQLTSGLWVVTISWTLIIN